MNNFFTCLLIMAFCSALTNAHSQALYPVSIDVKIAKSSHIIEGKVVDQKSFWNPGHTMIFTANTVEVYKAFKGAVQSSTIEVMTVGGTIGTQSVEASDLLTLEKNTICIFFCFPNSINLRSPFTGSQLYDVYSSGQGCYTYDLHAKSASAPFVRYASVQNQLYKELIEKTGHQPTIVNSSFDISGQARPVSPLAPAITGFSPQLVNAGAVSDVANNLLTIDGSGFSNTPTGTSAVLFDDANNGSGGTPFVVPYNSPLIQSWTDNQIKVSVPSRAGTGSFSVRDELSNEVVSPAILSIGYSVLSLETTSGTKVVKEINLMNSNSSGGYTVLYSTGTAGGGVDINAAPEKLTFQRALNTWKEIAGFNVIEGGTTTVQAVASDGNNTVLFDNTNTGNPPLADGVLAVCYSFFSYCIPITNYGVQKTDFDIVIRNAGVSVGTASFTSGPCAPASPYTDIDMETVLLHELGHGLNLAHINDSYQNTSGYPNVNPGKLMNYAILQGVSRKSPDYSALTGALYCINPKSNTYGFCSLPNVEMTPLVRTITANDECPFTFPTTSTPANTTVSFDLVHATSNKNTDPAFNGVICGSTNGTSVTNNAYFVLRSDNNGGDLNIAVSGYATLPSSVTGCVGSGVRLVIFQVNSCPAGQSFPAPLFCRTITRNGSLAVISGLAANTNYMIYVDGLDNTKANFTLTLNGTVLPVTLLDFKGIVSGGQVNLFWKTTREIDSKEFIVEKSLDGTAFNSFEIVAAKGNSNSETTYGITDANPYSNFTFYRLKIADKDGRFQYSNIIKIATPKKAIVVGRVYPNPTSGKINLQVIAENRKILTVAVFDLLGKKLANINFAVEQGVTEQSISVTALATGTYFIQVKDENGVVVQKSKFIKN
jgi:hypothetical protein